MLKVHSIESFGTQDGPGVRYVLFLQGCMFKCLYCHNPDTIPLLGGTDMEDDEIVRQVLSVKGYFGTKGGFTVSGGEPLLQAQGLISLFQKLKAEGIHITVDTNGFPRNDAVKQVVELADLFMVDIKHIDNALHQKLTGQSNQNTLAFIDYLQEKGKSMWIRHVLVPGYSTQAACLETIGKLYGNYSCVERAEILPYHQLGVHKWEEMGRTYELEGVPPATLEQAEEAKKIRETYFKKVVIR